VILVGNINAYVADRMWEAGEGAVLTSADFATFEGCEVEFGGCIGVAVEWRA